MDRRCRPFPQCWQTGDNTEYCGDAGSIHIVKLNQSRRINYLYGVIISAAIYKCQLMLLLWIYIIIIMGTYWSATGWGDGTVKHTLANRKLNPETIIKSRKTDPSLLPLYLKTQEMRVLSLWGYDREFVFNAKQNAHNGRTSEPISFSL